MVYGSNGYGLWFKVIMAMVEPSYDLKLISRDLAKVHIGRYSKMLMSGDFICKVAMRGG